MELLWFRSMNRLSLHLFLREKTRQLSSLPSTSTSPSPLQSISRAAFPMCLSKPITAGEKEDLPILADEEEENRLNVEKELQLLAKTEKGVQTECQTSGTRDPAQVDGDGNPDPENGSNLKYWLAVGAGALVAGVAAPVAIPAAVTAAGFGAGGIVGGSTGAWLMSTGAVPGLVAACQSIGTTGAIAGTTQALAGGLVAGAGTLTRFWRWRSRL